MAEKKKIEKIGKDKNPMKQIIIDKVTLNIGMGVGGEQLEIAASLLEKITGCKPVQTLAKVRNPTFKIRKGNPIGVKVTVRGKGAEELLGRALKSVEGKLSKRSFDRTGNFSFGVKEYIDFPGMKYDPRIGIMGFDVCVTLRRPGWRVASRHRAKSGVGKPHAITKAEAIEFAKGLGAEVF